MKKYEKLSLKKKPAKKPVSKQQKPALKKVVYKSKEHVSTTSVNAEAEKFFSNMEGHAKKFLESADPLSENLFGVNLFVLTKKENSPSLPVVHVPMTSIISQSEREDMVKQCAHKIGGDRSIDALAFLVIGEAWMQSTSKDAQEDSKEVAEVLVISAQDADGNYKISIKKIQRTPFGIFLKDYIKSDGWKRVDGSSDEIECMDELGKKSDARMTKRDHITEMAWKEYTLARLLAGVNINQ